MNRYRQFDSKLSRLTAASWIMKLWPVPAGILTASLSAGAVTAAADGNVRSVLINGGLLLAVVTLMKAAQIITETAYRKSEAKRLHECKMLLYERFLSSPLPVLYASQTGDAKEKLTDDFGNVTGRRLTLLPGLFASLITAAAYSAVIAMGSVFIALSLLVISLAQFIPPIIVKRYLEKNYRDCRETEAAITDHTVAGLRGFAELKIFDLGGWWDRKMAEYHKEYLKTGYGSDLAGTVESSMDSLLSLILRYGSCAVIGLLILHGKADIQTGVEAIALSGGLFSAVKTIFDSIPRFGTAKEAEKRLSSWTGGSGGGKLPDGSGIKISRVTNTAGDKKLLSNASAEIITSKITVIRGDNGTGKSTLLHMIAGIAEPDAGKITIGNAAPSELSPDTFPKRIFWLPQEDADIDLTPNEIYRALGAEGAAEKAASLGLSAEAVDRRITDLSGGERKKAYLALALDLSPEYLLLDEPTNSLDAESVGTLISMLRERKMSGLGALIVTHEPHVFEAADEIITMSEGELRREG